MPWNLSHLFRISFQFSGGLSGSHFPVARLMGTLKMAVDVSAAMKKPAAIHLVNLTGSLVPEE
jgi:hypothetical protein